MPAVICLFVSLNMLKISTHSVGNQRVCPIQSSQPTSLVPSLRICLRHTLETLHLNHVHDGNNVNGNEHVAKQKV